MEAPMINDPEIREEFYKALTKRDTRYAGIFFAGVTTTGIFCISTCRARKPKPENVSFFRTPKEALQHGFRPCKICRPTENIDAPPADVQHLMGLVLEKPENKINDQKIRSLGYQPEKIRRWFKRHLDMTFQAYQRMIRLNMAYEKLKSGDRVSTAAFDSGFESLSGMGYSFKSIFEASPTAISNMNIIMLHRFTTPLGPMYAGTSDKGLCLLEFTDRRALETEFEELSKRLQAKIIAGHNEIHEQTEQQIGEYFKGTRKEFTIPLDMPGTPFQQQVWNQLLTIPYGRTRSYKEQANLLGKPSAVRAVASANGQNRIAIIVPCHRVIGSNGDLTGYAGGLPRKKHLLELENRDQMSIFSQ
ncbi:bifunctional transcriptional activator/DNA repair enzyme AdaA [Fulvivirga sedimenti]|uniref:bifunctional transcriptional activator/DNA repair enzyme AdaA n=1 Tax=Fulvivirga sedimenti TaxID=2879465 RepID=UPI0023DE80E7|nr:methylated-DNA--[protein]-cysteine S-methyltransferase [Fulvivirga sedimenti]